MNRGKKVCSLEVVLTPSTSPLPLYICTWRNGKHRDLNTKIEQYYLGNFFVPEPNSRSHTCLNPDKMRKRPSVPVPVTLELPQAARGRSHISVYLERTRAFGHISRVKSYRYQGSSLCV